MSVDSNDDEPRTQITPDCILLWMSFPYKYALTLRNRIVHAGIASADNEHTQCLKRLAININIGYVVFLVLVSVYVNLFSPVYMQREYLPFRLFVTLGIPCSLLSFVLYTFFHSLLPIYLPPALYSLLLPHILWLCRRCFYPAPSLHWGFAGVILVVAFGTNWQAKLMACLHLMNTFLVPVLQKLITPENCTIQTGTSVEQLLVLSVESALPSCVAFVTAFQLTALLQFDQRTAFLEKQMAESLLQAILPKNIAEQLQSHMLLERPAPISKQHPNVTVAFADLVGFTSACLTTTAEEVVGTLNSLFICFDMLCLEFQVEKIKTIGDAYMYVGFPENDDSFENAAIRAIRVGMKMVKKAKDFYINDYQLQVRVGAHSGPAVAGVIGCTKFCYDLWGPTVNLASRLESNGVPGKVQVSHETAHLVGKEFVCTYRETMTLKGAGTHPCYLVQSDNNNTVSSTSDTSYLAKLVGLSEIAAIAKRHENYRRLMSWSDFDSDLAPYSNFKRVNSTRSSPERSNIITNTSAAVTPVPNLSTNRRPSIPYIDAFNRLMPGRSRSNEPTEQAGINEGSIIPGDLTTINSLRIM